MADVVFFHSALGLRPAVRAAAERLRAAGHTVRTPDLYDGRTAGNVADGVALAQQLGMVVLMERARDAVADVPAGAVYAGLSLGSGVAARIAKLRGDASALVLLHGSPELTGLDGLPVTLHAASPDDWVEEDELDVLKPRQHTEIFRYDAVSHLYTDPGTRESKPLDAEAAELTWQRVLAFLAR
ncbi:dienelactone hydrolase family protein [Amycolatopsis sp. H20-H5]|uniref:dienelactone hydrolase family protein n=1 Tax=Amycolatopsis sp. H20-H5 TaxID=3046309 RepID=UPI002DBA1F25|nr:dienelactone hydrolase family protein [Amycolatopsis sp. H20-H5]MEC3978360.1 dienelactone hydrolase family protein [Amycolatopsis sp. H20-H5]